MRRAKLSMRGVERGGGWVGLASYSILVKGHCHVTIKYLIFSPCSSPDLLDSLSLPRALALSGAAIAG